MRGTILTLRRISDKNTPYFPTRVYLCLIFLFTSNFPTRLQIKPYVMSHGESKFVFIKFQRSCERLAMNRSMPIVKKVSYVHKRIWIYTCIWIWPANMFAGDWSLISYSKGHSNPFYVHFKSGVCLLSIFRRKFRTTKLGQNWIRIGKRMISS